MDGNPDVYESALRELEEEAGLKPPHVCPLFGGGIFDLSVGLVPTRMKAHGLEPLHLHFDVCFAFEADLATPLTISEESFELCWVSVTEALTMLLDCHRRRAEKTLAGVLK